MKMYIYITNPESWLSLPPTHRGHLLQIHDSDSMVEYGWILVQEMEVDVSHMSDDVIREAALKKINDDEQRQVAENEVQMQRFDERRQKLLAIEHQPDPVEYPIG